MHAESHVFEALSATPSSWRDDESALLRNILESSTEYSMIATDLDGGIVLWNSGASRRYGYSPEEVVGRANLALLHAPHEQADGRPAKLLAAALQKANGKARSSAFARAASASRRRWSSRRVLTSPAAPSAFC